MKKAVKRITGLVTGACLGIGMLAGCGSSSTASSAASAADSSSSAAASAESAVSGASSASTAAASETASESTGSEQVVTSSVGSSSDVYASYERVTDAPDTFNYIPVVNTTGKEIKICVLTVSNNPFWNTVVDGINAAKDYLANQNTTVDVVEFDDFDGQGFADAIDTCIAKQYDAITTVGVADTIVPAIDRAAAAGIPVYTFNTDTEKESKRVAFVGQDLYTAGEKLADEMANLIESKGKVAIITGYYNVSSHELRRQGIEDEIKNKYPDMEVVGSVENHDSGDEAYSAAKNFITANPDLKGIFVTAGGPHGAAKALSELGKSNDIALCCFDTTDEIIKYLESGDIKATITQDPFGQGCDPIVLAYNQVVTGTPEKTGDAYTALDVYTPDNVSELE